MTTWYSNATDEEIERLEEAWVDAPTDKPELCSFILSTARDQVIAFAPKPSGAVNATAVPERYVLAQIQQAENLWNAGRAQQGGEVGTEGYSFVPRPLDKNIRAMIRPRSGAPRVF